jgi:hypothetical protein
MGMEFGIGYGVDNYKEGTAEQTGIAGQPAKLMTAERSEGGYSSGMFNTGFRVGFVLK